MKSPLIKPSHKGLLHQELGIPEGQKIGEARLEAAKHSGNPVEAKRANFALNFNDHGTHGLVSEVSMHPNGKHATIDVVHGRKPPLTPAQKQKQKEQGYPMYDDRPHSRITIPKAQAHRYHVGQAVGVGAIPLQGPGTDEMDDAPDQDEAMDNYHQTMRNIITPRKRGS